MSACDSALARASTTSSSSGTLPSAGNAHSATESRSSAMIASGSNGVPNTVSANSRSGPELPAPEPSVAEVATGVMPVSGPSTPCVPRAIPRRRSSIATSVPCAPS